MQSTTDAEVRKDKARKEGAARDMLCDWCTYVLINRGNESSDWLANCQFHSLVQIRHKLEDRGNLKNR
jgi:hypothetical protein